MLRVEGASRYTKPRTHRVRGFGCHGTSSASLFRRGESRLDGRQQDGKRSACLIEVTKNIGAAELVRRSRDAGRVAKVDRVLRQPGHSADGIRGSSIKPPYLLDQAA